MSEEALQIAEKRREAEDKGKDIPIWQQSSFCERQKERHTHLNAEFQRIARRDKIAFLTDQLKEREENNRMGKTRDLLKKIRHTKG